MNKFLPAISLAFFFWQSAEGQRNKSEDVLYLKNRWVLRGAILQKTDSSVKIRSNDGNIYVFAQREVDSMTREIPWSKVIIFRQGFRSYTELGPLIAGRTTIDGVTTAAFSFQTFLGYAVRRHLLPGVGAGADLYATQTILPIFGSIRGDLLSSGDIIPFYFGDLGYGLNITQPSADGRDFKGGLLYAAGLGIRIPFNRKAGFLLSAGYRYQETSYTTGLLVRQVTYQRLAIRAGFYF